MSTPTETPVSDASPEAPTSRDEIIWNKLLSSLADSDDADMQLASLRILAELEADDLPIPEITTMLLTQTHQHNGTLMLSDSDDLWTEGLDLLECAPNRAPLDIVVSTLCDAFEEESDTEMVLELIARLEGIDDPQPFIDLLSDAAPVICQAGLEALFRLNLSEPILPFLTDDEPETRALALENAWCLEAITHADLERYATDEQQPEEVRAKAQYWLNKANKTHS